MLIDDRISTIDYMKALAIVGVVINHAGDIPWLPGATWVDRFVRGSLVQFHVPVFLVIAGFLSAVDARMRFATLRKRLARLLVPYVVASVLAFAVGVASPATVSEGAYMLATGSALGIYYFVFILAVSYVFTFALTRISSKAPLYVLPAMLGWWAVRWLFVAPAPPPGPLPDFWFFRNPGWSYPYFLAGWLTRLHWSDATHFWQTYKRHALVGAAIVIPIYATGYALLRGTPFAVPARATYVAAFMVIAIAATERLKAPRIVHHLSEASYSIYLYHYFFMAPLLGATKSFSPSARIAGLSLVGIVGALAITWLGRLVLGRHSRMLLGC